MKKLPKNTMTPPPPFEEKSFEKKLLALKDSQESISTLSDWCLQNKHYHKKIVNTWLHVFKRVKVENRLTLFYLANDVIQYSKRKNYEFVESWGTALQRATTMVRDDKVINRILRIFTIWGERNVYDDAFLSDLRGLLTATRGVSKNTPSKEKDKEKEKEKDKEKEKHSEPTPAPAPFEPSNLFLKIDNCKQLEEDTDLRLKLVNEGKVKINELDSFLKSLKDRKHADDMATDFDDAINLMEQYKKALQVEIRERKAVIELLVQAEKFYECERGEAKIVFNAYRNFGSRVKAQKRKLDDLIPTLPSPIPSPDINAPSPSPDSDIDLPNDEDLSGRSKEVLQPAPEIPSVGSMPNCSSTFMGSGMLPFDIQRNLFSDERVETPGSSLDIRKALSVAEYELEGKPIEVISRRSKEEEAANLFTNLVQGSPATSKPSVIPGLGDPLPVPPPAANPTPRIDYAATTSTTSPLPPPPLPPSMFDSDYTQGQETRDREDGWNTALPAKFPTWRDTAESNWERDDSLGNGGNEGGDWMPALPVPNMPPPPLPLNIETPESPPVFEKESFREPVEYDDSGLGRNPLIGGADVDHRQFLAHQTPSKDVDHRILTSRFKKDVDHRNLISLTGSPGELPPPPMPISLWGSTDQDYRTTPPPPRTQARSQRQAGATDIVESVDMEMSDEEDEHHHREKVPRLSDEKKSNTSGPSKAVSESPVKGKDKSPLNRTSESPQAQRFQHPPPPPHPFQHSRFPLPPGPPPGLPLGLPPGLTGPPPGIPISSAPPGLQLRLRPSVPLPPLPGTPPNVPTSPASFTPTTQSCVNTPPPLPSQQGTPGATGATSSGPEESDTDSIGQYLNMGLSDDEDIKDLVASMDPQILAEVMEATSRNGAENSDSAAVLNNGDSAEGENDWSSTAESADVNNHPGFIPHGVRPWKTRPGAPGPPTGGPLSPSRFRGQSPNWRSPQIHDRGGYGRGGRGRNFRQFRGGPPRGGPRQSFGGW